jgi:tRNA U34 2-thiouridine synthase MnmA/TrmU
MASSNKKEWMLEKLNRLVKLCKATEPDKPDDLHLFQPNIIDAHEMYNKVNVAYDSLNSEERVEIMVEANKIWKFRRKVYNGDIDCNWQSKLDSELEYLIKKGHVINAIKHYRNEIKKESGNPPSLKDSKDYVDKMKSNMGIT